MYPQYNPGGTPYQRDPFSEGIASYTGPDRFFPGRRAKLHQQRQYSGTVIHVLPEIVVRARQFGYTPYYNPLTDVYYPPDRTVNVAPSGGGAPDVPGSERKPGAKKKKATPSQGNSGAFQDIVKGAWQRG